ncbi:hypothetical protein C8J56DRAFT_564590 [Mycena floridula]|nr:hypothetical protein C8J56DRAFT_564590 [Mycena floridula]
MSSSSRSTSITSLFLGITAVGLVAYAVYFDYKRRNDAEFRKKLRKEKKRIDKSIASSQASLVSSNTVSAAALRQALDQVKSEGIPPSSDEREGYFMNQVGLGEQLATRGEEFYLPAAMSFFRALRVYPSPVELMVIYQKTVPEPIFNLVIQLTNLDNQNKFQGYYDHFPSKSYNVAIQSDPNMKLKKIVVAERDFKLGETIYKEQPVVTALDLDLYGKATHCSHCLRSMDPSIAIKPARDPLSSTYCSKACQLAASSQYHTLLFSLDRPLPGLVTPPPTPAELDARLKAQTQFVAHLETEQKSSLLLVAKILARKIVIETEKILPSLSSSKHDFADSVTGESTIDDHLERLRYIDVKAADESLGFTRSLLATAVDSLAQVIDDERFAILAGKMSYNAYGVCFSGGRDDKPSSDARPEDIERTRTPYGTSRQIGQAFYTLSSYLNHSCIPSARPSFSAGTAELHLIACRDIKKGEELTVAFVDVTQHPDESVAECRMRRRTELARGWKFACPCNRCRDEAEGPQAIQTDQSKVEASVARWESA